MGRGANPRMTQCHALFFYAAAQRLPCGPMPAPICAAGVLHLLYTHPEQLLPSFTRVLLLLHLSKTPFEEGTEMDLVYLGGLVVFTALTLALIVGFDKLRRGPGGRP